ncbi:uma4 protein [Microcystis aeruginosa TAIHU98]|uniref:Uma4 protein n=1 Tax=Microcystis aeruginosa TAIHU98 TaxID=1134457 RepID=L7E4M4_MICAE|nr:uma4 protein [Microcystis aeruginosa TAIHU98]
MAKNEIILLMILDKFLNLQGTCIQGYRHLENIGIVFQIESKIKKQPVLVVG